MAMRRVARELAAAIVGLALASSGTASAQQLLASTRPLHVVTSPVAAVPVLGSISGVVSDERGGPLSGAMVSVIGEKIQSCVTRADGHFSIPGLPLGRYTLRANRAGFAVSRAEEVTLGSAVAPFYRLQLRRLDAAVGTTGTANETVPSRPIVAAGVELPRTEGTQAKAGDDADHPHTDAAYRLRHLPRSILKDANGNSVATDDIPDDTPNSFLGRATGATASMFADLPFTGEVNLLTTSALGTDSFFSDGMPRGVAYFSLGAPTPAGNWLVHAAMSEGELSSWIVAGSFLSHRNTIHSYDLGFSYSTQESQPANPVALAAVADSTGSRNVGEISAIDRWTFPNVSFEYGGSYARYDYVSRSGLWSPRVALTVQPMTATRVVAQVSQRMIAPGAEEFLAPQAPGPWLPPERTFSALFPNRDLRVERVGTIDLLLEHDLDSRVAIAVRRFFQGADNQLVTLFGVALPDVPSSNGHYYFANIGSVATEGWGLRLATLPAQRVHASVEYTHASAEWAPRRGTMKTLRALAPAAVRSDFESFNDVTTSFETSFNDSATRVFLLYKINSAFSHDAADSPRPGLDGRFDVQVNQALPFELAGTRWEVLVGLRNLFRDPNDPASVYDELLVVRPPKRLVGGFLVRF
jgi:carboxypeptidase family protein